MPTDFALEARFNVATDGKRFRCDFIREGPVDYSDRKLGVECLRRTTIAKALDTFIGKPLIIEHVDPRLNVAEAIASGKMVPHGVCDKVGYDVESGWFFVEGEVTTDVGRTAALTMNPSCGYNVRMTGPAGRWNNVPFERELTEIEFHHLALCAGRSRYEESDFRLNAILSPTTGKITMFKLIKTIKAAISGQPAVTEEVALPAETMIEIGGKQVRLNEAAEAYTDAEKKKKEDDEAETKAAKKDDDAAARENALNGDSEVLVGGKKVKVSDLTAAYTARENATAAAAQKAKDDTARENAAGREDFNKIQRAAAGAPVVRTDFPTTAGGMDEKLKRGVY